MGLLKMDFLGLSTLTLIDDCLQEIERTTRRARRPRPDSAHRREDLPVVRRRAHARGVPVRELGHAGHAAEGAPAAVRGPHRPERALPARPAEGRGRRRLHRPAARPEGDRVPGAAARAHPARDLRRHRLPGAGDAHRARPRRLHDGRGRPAAQGDGQEERRRHEGAARPVRRGRDQARDRAQEGRAHLRPDGGTSPATGSTSRTRPPTRCWPTTRAT